MNVVTKTPERDFCYVGTHGISKSAIRSEFRENRPGQSLGEGFVVTKKLLEPESSRLYRAKRGSWVKTAGERQYDQVLLRSMRAKDAKLPA